MTCSMAGRAPTVWKAMPGNDIYVVDDIGDRVFETPGNGADPGGYDTVQSSVSWHLGAYIENLTLTGTDNINATGNELVNILRGNTATTS